MITETLKPDNVSLRISVTDRCQLRCLYCIPVEGNDNYHNANPLSFDEIIHFVNFLNQHYCLSKVHITGGEPLLRHGIVDLIGRLSDTGIRDIALTTNGQLLGEMARDLKSAGLRRVNISLDSLNPKNFRKLTHRGELCRTLTGIEAAIECGFNPVKLNTVVIKNRNDHEVIDIAEYGIANHCQVRFLEIMPIGSSAVHFHGWFVPSNEIMMRLAEKFELRKITGQSGSSSRNYSACDSKGRTGIIGFISPITYPFCKGCRRLRLMSDGRLLGCLAQKEGFEIRSLLRGEYSSAVAPLFKVVRSALRIKYNSRCFDTREVMVKIGG